MSDTQNKWVLVSERLPEDVRKPYLVLTDEGKTPGIAHLRNDVWFPRDSCNRIPNVTHWMDLPEPPKPTDPFEAWWAMKTGGFNVEGDGKEMGREAWYVAKEHYSKPNHYTLGYEDAAIAFESMVNRILEGKEDGTGKLEIPQLEKLRHVLLERLKPLPDFETWWDNGAYLGQNVRKFRDMLLHKDMVRPIWNAAQGKPEA